MKKTFRKVLAVAASAAMVISMAGCGGKAEAPAADNGNGGSSAEAAADAGANAGGGNSSLKGQNVRVVIGSTSTSGDSYMIADLVTRYLSKEMGFNGKVDAIGNAAALDEMQNAKGDGKTVMIFH